MMTGEYDDDDDEDDEENGGVPMDDDEDENSATLNLPQRRIDDDAGGDEDKIEKVVSNDAQKPSSQLQKAAAAAAAAEQAAATRAAPEQQQQQLQTPAAAATTTVAPETAVPTKEEEAEEEDDIDPLDAFMAGIQEEVKKYRTQTLSKADPEKGHHKVTVVVGVAKKKTAERSRGELIEQNQDAMEYSSSDEVEKGDELANAMDTLQAKAKQKKPLTISLDDISYIPFRKNFYIEVPEIGRMTAEEVEAYKTEMEGIKTKGKGCPRPIKNWAQCGVSKKVMDILKKNNFEKPTPIQCQAIPAIMSGRDLIGIAKTGSGKTLAFLIPMFRHILDQPRLEPGDGPIAIIMTPTRELATQIYGQCRKFTKYLSHLGRGDRGDAGSSSRDSKENRLRVVAVYGGTPISEQIGDLKPGAEIVVCTPGRMIDMLAANSGRVTNLRRCTYVVLDEADRMFDMGFEPQVMRIIDGIRPDRQTVMFSATFPRIMEALARRILDKPIEVQVGGRSVVAKEVEQNVVIIKEDDKFLKLLEVLGKYATAGSAIVFVDKQEHADMLLKELMHASYTVLALHGGIDQNDRDSTISDFKNGKVNVLVATSVAARGLDVKHTIVVVNYDCPNHYEDYVHRCGRTGRAGNKGHAYTFITPEQGRYAQDLIKAHEQSGIPVPAELQKLFDDYKVEQEAMGKKVKSSSGFSGKGFKFDEAEAQQAIEKKRIQKAALGLNDSDDEEVEKTDADIDQEIENMLAPKKKAEKGTATAAATAAAAVAAAAATAAALSASGSSSSAAAGPSTPTITPSASVAAAVAAAAAAAASINASLAAASSASGVGASISTAPPASSAQPERSIAEKMELAKQMASKIALSIPNLPSSASLSASAASSSSTGSSLTSNYPSATAHTEAILKGDTYSLGDITSAVTAKSIAEQRAERLHAKLNYIPRDSDYNDSGELVGRRGLGVGGGGGGLLDSMDVDMGAGPDGLGGGGGSMGGLAGGSGLGGSSSSNVSQRIEQELEINDFPQQARWRVTSKEAIAQISEFSEAGITVRGTYYPQGKEPPAGERKLYLAIEATNEKAVSLARAEIVRLIKEELHKMSNSNLPARGNRYKVL